MTPEQILATALQAVMPLKAMAYTLAGLLLANGAAVVLVGRRIYARFESLEQTVEQLKTALAMMGDKKVSVEHHTASVTGIHDKVNALALELARFQERVKVREEMARS